MFTLAPAKGVDVDRSAPASGIDASFTLDAAELAQRKAASARRIHTLQIPAIRTGGFVILCAIAVLQDLRLPGPFPSPQLLLLIAANLSFAALCWLVSWLGHGRSGRLDISLLLFHLDVPVWLLSLHHLEPSSLFFAYFLLVRVADQASVGVRRAVYFNHVVIVVYLAYVAWMAGHEPDSARTADRLTIAAIMYLLGSYLAFTGTVAERLRYRTRQAVRAARELVDNLEQKTRALQAQAAELDQARRQAEEANLAKSQFLALISHEIRTPMNGILGTTELLLATPLTPAQRQYAQTAHHSGAALLALIDDVLDLSRIEAGKLTLHNADIDLRALVTEAVGLMAATGRDKPVALTFSIAPEVPACVQGDPVRLRQLLVNLLHNAIKFTERGSVGLSVTVVEQGEETIRIGFAVQDTGIGIAEDKIDSVFDKFMQADTSSTRRHGGSGLGLAIVKEIVDLMGGHVGVESQLGEGSIFWVELDLKKSAEAALPPEPAAGAVGALSARVLLAEDDLVNQMVIEEMLRLLGCEVVVVNNGDEARVATSRSRYDLVFMDCHMPGMDGFEAAHHIRAEERTSGTRTPIVALTADALAGDRERCLAAGMDDYMTKPVSSARLAAAVRRWAAR